MTKQLNNIIQNNELYRRYTGSITGDIIYLGNTLMGLTNRNRLLNNHGSDQALKGFWYSLPK